MLRAKAHPPAIASPDDKRTRQLPIRHVTQLRHLVGDVVEADRQEVGEHDLRDRPQSRHRRAHRGAENRLFGDRRISHAQRPELLVEADGRLEHAARLADILAEEYDARIALHFLRDAACDRVAIGQFRHAQPPSAYTSRVSNSIGAGGEALHASVAASTLRLLSASIAPTVSSGTPNSLRRSR